MPSRIAEDFNCREMFRRADNFAHSSGILEGSLTASLLHATLFAQVVCDAFACEAYLKILFSLTDNKNRKPLKTHNLKHLFEDLPANYQDRIEAEWSIAEMPTINAAREHYPTEARVPYSFREALAVCAFAFVDWRYAPSGQRWWLAGFRIAIRRCIVEIQPDWAPPADYGNPIDLTKLGLPSAPVQ